MFEYRGEMYSIAGNKKGLMQRVGMSRIPNGLKRKKTTLEAAHVWKHSKPNLPFVEPCLWHPIQHQ